MDSRFHLKIFCRVPACSFHHLNHLHSMLKIPLLLRKHLQAFNSLNTTYSTSSLQQIRPVPFLQLSHTIPKLIESIITQTSRKSINHTLNSSSHPSNINESIAPFSHPHIGKKQFILLQKPLQFPLLFQTHIAQRAGTTPLQPSVPQRTMTTDAADPCVETLLVRDANVQDITIQFHVLG